MIQLTEEEKKEWKVVSGNWIENKASPWRYLSKIYNFKTGIIVDHVWESLVVLIFKYREYITGFLVHIGGGKTGVIDKIDLPLYEKDGSISELRLILYDYRDLEDRPDYMIRIDLEY